MSWLAQLGHVLAKDVRHARWLLLAHGVVVAMATAHAVGWAPLAHAALGGLMLLVVMSGMVVVAFAVQDDSPVRSDAFWTAHPLRPTAVAGAKVAFSLLLLALALLGQAIAVRSYDVYGGDALLVLGRSAALYGASLLAATIVAALLRDLRSFALTIVVIPMALFMASIGLAIAGASPVLPSRGVLHVLQALVALAGLAVLGWLYRTRDVRSRTRGAVLVVAVIAFLALGARVPDVTRDAPTIAERYPLALELGREGLRPDGGTQRVTVRAAAVPRDVRLVLVRGVLVLRLRDGSVLRLPADDQFQDLGVFSPALPRVPGVRWLGVSEHSEAHGAVSVTLPPDARRAIAAGVSSIELEGRILVIGGRALGTMPPRVGSEVTEAGRRVRIEAWSQEFDEPVLELTTTTLGARGLPPGFQEQTLVHDVQAALVNVARGEAVPLEFTGASGSVAGLVIPGAEVSTYEGHFTRTRTDNPGPRARAVSASLDDAWLRDARLMVITPEVRGSYPIRLRLDIP